MRKIKSKKLTYVLKRVFSAIINDNMADLAATLAYYFLLSLFPLLIFCVALLPYLSIEAEAAIPLVKDLVPKMAADSIDQTVRGIVENRRVDVLSFSFLATLWIASNAMGAIIRALNVAYQVEETRSYFRVRMVATGLTVAFVLVLAVMLVLPVFGQVIFGFIQKLFPLPAKAWVVFSLLRWLTAFLLANMVLIGIYQIAPNVTLPLRKVAVGALTATIGWQLISLAFSSYVSNFSHYSTTYGSLGGVIVLMIWFYLTGLILVIGGVINAAIHRYQQEEKR